MVAFTSYNVSVAPLFLLLFSPILLYSLAHTSMSLLSVGGCSWTIYKSLTWTILSLFPSPPMPHFHTFHCAASIKGMKKAGMFERRDRSVSLKRDALDPHGRNFRLKGTILARRLTPSVLRRLLYLLIQFYSSLGKLSNNQQLWACLQYPSLYTISSFLKLWQI